MKRLAAVAACVLLLAGCDDGPAPARTEMHVSTELSGDGNRVTVTRLSKFRDSLAYDNERGVYLIRDTQTGKEFIGVSGIGITELGSHTYACGKSRCTTGDER
jgi:hypothetical protein